MKTFKVITDHIVNVDSYVNGEEKQVNSYITRSEQKAETPREAIEKHFEKELYFKFDFDKADTNEEKTAMFWSNLVDEDNGEATEGDIKAWKEETRVLYSNSTYITVSEIVPVKFD